MHLPNSFEDSINSKLFRCAGDDAHQGVMFLINHGVLLRVQQAPFLNLCFSIITIVTLARILNSFFCLHSSPSSLLGLFLCLYHWTKVHTYVSKRVKLHTLLEIMVKFVSYFFKYCGWPSSNEIGLLFCKFHFSQSFNWSQCCKCIFCLFFIFPFLPFVF